MYRTAQKNELLSYLREHCDEQFSAAQLSEALGGSVGESTVYRLVDGLTREGVLKAFPRRSGRGYLYQYHRGQDCDRHFHLKCSGCGRLMHLECEQSNTLLAHILEEHGFSVNLGESILYGECESCRRKKQAETI